MADRQARFYEILNYINDQLSSDNRNMLCFLLQTDVPQTLLDEVRDNIRVPMHNIFRALIERGRICPTDLNYLVERLQGIKRIDLVRYIQKHMPTEVAATSPSLFRRHDPEPPAL